MKKLAALAALPLALTACSGSASGQSVDDTKKAAVEAGLSCGHYEHLEPEPDSGLDGWSVCDGELDNPTPGVQFFAFDNNGSGKAGDAWARKKHADVLRKSNWIMVDRERTHNLKALAERMDAEFISGE